MDKEKQSMAMRLVDEHESDDWIAGTRQWREEASATIRSQIARIAELEAENASLRDECEVLIGEAVRRGEEIASLREQCVELLAVSKLALNEMCYANSLRGSFYSAVDALDAAIERAHGIKE